jgi:transcriptional regulator with XRE-family HTH domain
MSAKNNLGQIAQRIKYIRDQHGRSQSSFASALGVTRSHISKIETGKNVPSNQLIKSICRQYGIREKWLREGKSSPEKSPLTAKQIQEVDSVLESMKYTSAIRYFQFANISIKQIIKSIKSHAIFTIDPDHPQAVEFLKLKKQLRQHVNRLRKILSQTKH